MKIRFRQVLDNDFGFVQVHAKNMVTGQTAYLSGPAGTESTEKMKATLKKCLSRVY